MRTTALLAVLAAGALSRTAEAQTDVTVTQNVLGLTYKYSGVNCDTIIGTDIELDDTLRSYLAEVPYNLVRVRGLVLLPGTTPFDGFTVDQVKADPKVLDWTRIETFYPKNVTTWVKGLAGTGIIVSPMLVWNRNHQSSGDCAKSAVFKTQADQDLFWLAAFGMAYWGNVVNKYGLTHMEVSNEPDNCGGNQVNTPDTATHNRMMELA